MVIRKLHPWILALCLPIALFVGCDDDGDGTGDADAGDVAFEMTSDIQEETTDVQEEETGREIDEALVGIYSFASATGAAGTITPNWQNAPAPGSPDREMRMTGAITTRSDGTYTRILKLIIRDEPGEEEVEDEEDSQLFPGTWYVEGDHLIGQDDDEEEPDEWTYNYNESTGLLTLDNLDPGEGEPAQIVWRRETLDADLIASWDIVSADVEGIPVVLTTENQEITGPEGTFSARVSGSLAVDADGFYSQEALIWVDDSEADDASEDGLWYTQDDILVTEAPDSDRVEWEYTVDLGTGLFTQRQEGVLEIIWQLREE